MKLTALLFVPMGKISRIEFLLGLLFELIIGGAFFFTFPLATKDKPLLQLVTIVWIFYIWMYPLTILGLKRLKDVDASLLWVVPIFPLILFTSLVLWHDLSLLEYFYHFVLPQDRFLSIIFHLLVLLCLISAVIQLLRPSKKNSI